MPAAGGRDDSERWLYLWFAAPLALILSLALLVEWYVATVWGGDYSQSMLDWRWAVRVWVVALLPTLVAVASILPVYPVGRPVWWRGTITVLASVLAGFLRLATQMFFWGAPFFSGPVTWDVAVGTLIAVVSIGAPMYLARSQVAAVRAERRAVENDFRSRQAALELENEELRVRREVSDMLHGRVQQRLVFLAAQLDSLAKEAEERDDQATAERLRQVTADMDQVREADVRELSHSLFPVGVDIGLCPALSLLIGKVPPSVAVTLEVADAAAQADDVADPRLDLAERALLLGVAEEAITNAVKHGRANAITVSVTLDGVDQGGDRMVLTVVNNGEAPAAQPTLSGLGPLKAKARQHGGDLELLKRDDGLTELRAWITLLQTRDAAA
jgi:signal transduction histidine kinase